METSGACILLTLVTGFLSPCLAILDREGWVVVGEADSGQELGGGTDSVDRYQRRLSQGDTYKDHSDTLYDNPDTSLYTHRNGAQPNLNHKSSDYRQRYGLQPIYNSESNDNAKRYASNPHSNQKKSDLNSIYESNDYAHRYSQYPSFNHKASDNDQINPLQPNYIAKSGDLKHQDGPLPNQFPQYEDKHDPQTPGLLSWLFDMATRALEKQIRRRTGGLVGTGWRVRGEEKQDFDLDFDDVNVLGATIGTVGAIQELMLKVLEWGAFIVCDILFQIYWP